MMYYHCTDRNCESTFQMEHARNCPFCDGKMIRHAMGYEIDRMEQEHHPDHQGLPITALLRTIPAMAS